jgi:uncharacterized membrane protein YqjE
MLYLIISLIAGLVYVISGKVSYNKTVYLEGTKARIAGLIFLAPVGLMLVILGIVFILVVFGINISDSSSKLVDAFASIMVFNGFLIGLAYINFHSVLRETKERGGCLTRWLIFMALVMIYVIGGAQKSISNGQWSNYVSIVISAFEIIFFVGIWFWKKWGVIAYIAITLLSPIVAFLRTDYSILQAFVSLISSLSYILILYLLVKPKWQFFE